METGGGETIETSVVLTRELFAEFINKKCFEKGDFAVTRQPGV